MDSADLEELRLNSEASLRIILTQECNLRCGFCHNEGEQKGLEEIDEDIVYNSIIDYIKLGGRKVHFTGGEPTKLKGKLVDIIKKVDIISEKNNIDLDVGLTTNAQYLDFVYNGKTLAEGLADAGLKRLNISLHTLNEDSYIEILRPKDPNNHNLQNVLQNLELASNYFENIKINMVVGKNNFRDIPEMAAYTNSMKTKTGRMFDLRIFNIIPTNKWGKDNDVSMREINGWLKEHSIYHTQEKFNEVLHNVYNILYNNNEYIVKTKVGFEVSGSEDRSKYLRVTPEGKIRISLHSPEYDYLSSEKIDDSIGVMRRAWEDLELLYLNKNRDLILV